MLVSLDVNESCRQGRQGGGCWRLTSPMALLSLAVRLLVPHPTDEAPCPPFSLLQCPPWGLPVAVVFSPTPPSHVPSDSRAAVADPPHS